jgi:hypothetical protein
MTTRVCTPYSRFREVTADRRDQTVRKRLRACAQYVGYAVARNLTARARSATAAA